MYKVAISTKKEGNEAIGKKDREMTLLRIFFLFPLFLGIINKGEAATVNN